MQKLVIILITVFGLKSSSLLWHCCYDAAVWSPDCVTNFLTGIKRTLKTFLLLVFGQQILC